MKSELRVINDIVNVDTEDVIATTVDRTLTNCLMRCTKNLQCKDIGYGSTIADEFKSYLLNGGSHLQKPATDSIELHVVQVIFLNGFFYSVMFFLNLPNNELPLAMVRDLYLWCRIAL